MMAASNYSIVPINDATTVKTVTSADGGSPRRMHQSQLLAPSVTALAHRAFPELGADRPYHRTINVGDDSRMQVGFTKP
jgi:hypothetical protein